MARLRFHHYAWGLLAYNLAVILGGAFVRATDSGNGCGSHWPACNGALIPHPERVQTLIEFGHRASTSVLLPLVLVLLVWAFRAFPRGHGARPASVLVLVLTLVEALIGAALVRFELVAQDSSVLRAIVMPAHLIATFLLLKCLALAAWWGGGGQAPRLRGQGAMGWALGLGLLGTLLLGVSGAITALGDTLRAGLPSGHFLLSLRIYHPLFAISVGLYTTLLGALAMHLRPSPEVSRFAHLTIALFAAQTVAGFVNILLQAPVWMQLVHLLLADLVWVSLVLLTATATAVGAREPALSSSSSSGSGFGPPHPHTPTPPHPARATWRDYLALTKPRVISLLLLTTLAAMAIAAGGEPGPAPGWPLYVAVGLGLYMAAGAANAINMVLERDLDLRMGRTALRPTVTRAIPPRAALLFALCLMVGSFALLWGSANLLCAVLAQAGLAFYVLVYTLLLKRRTWLNIVIGGAAGAFPPLVGWAAVTGDLSPLAWCLFGIIFLWTPVHFWALALLIKDDYARAGVPMLPVVHGERATVVQIVIYTVLTAAITLIPALMQGGESGRAAFGWFYLAAAGLLNAVLFLRSIQLYRQPDRPRAKSLFKYSMVYLALLFLVMAVDRTPWF